MSIGASDGTATSAPAVSAGPDTAVSEGDGWVDLPVTLSAPGTNPVTVTYQTLNAGAGGGFGCNADYVPDNGTLTFLPGERIKVVRVQILDCLDVEGLEAFTLNLSNPAGGATITRASTRVLIGDNDTVVATPKLVVRDTTIDETAGQALMLVLLSGASNGVVAVDYSSADGTASSGSDYTAVSGTLTFLPGETAKLVAVPITDDADAEPSETFTFGLSNPSAATLGHGTGS